MKRQDQYGRILRFLNRLIVVFLMIAFAITCCLMLFLGLLRSELELDLNADNLNAAAKWTFANVVFLSLLYTIADWIKRKRTVERPVKTILAATERMMRGDFHVRIAPLHRGSSEYGLDAVIETINQMAEALEGIETLQSDFVANVSHELKTPLAVIHSYSVLLSDRQLEDAERIEYATAISEATQRLSGLVGNILKINKLEHQQFALNPARYDLGEQLCECLLGFEPTWEEKQIAIETEIGENVMVCADAELMTLVWNNLLSNAFKFTAIGGTVRVRVAEEGGMAVVCISDTGCGISKDVGTRIFDKFYQGDPSHATQGNGLGLALVKRVIDLTGCDISVESEPNVGSTFTVTMRSAGHETLENVVE